MPIQDITGVNSDARNLANFLQDVLDRVISAYNSYNMPIPARRYYSLSAPVVDCEQLCVAFIQMYIGTPGDEATQPRRCTDPRSASLSIQIARSVPVTQQNGQPPPAEDIQRASEVSALDAWILMESVNQFDSWAGSNPFGLGVIATVDSDPPEGGFQVTRLTITMAVP